VQVANKRSLKLELPFAILISLVMPTNINKRSHFPWWVKKNSLVSFFHPLQNNESKIELAQMGTLCAFAHPSYHIISYCHIATQPHEENAR
jgi:hypothetical protein